MRREVASGAIWVLGARGLTVAAQLGALLVLAWHLTEMDFGLAGMVAVVVGLVGVGADLGMEVIGIQRFGADDRRIAWVSELAGLVLAFALIAAAPLVSRAFGTPPGLTLLLRAGAAGLLFTGYAAPARARLRRALLFRRLAGVDVARAVIAAAGSVAFAVRGFGAWSLVLGDLVAGGLAAALAWLVAPAMRRGSGGRLLPDGLRIVGTRLFDACFAQADRFLVGSRLGAAALGLYGFAWRHAMLPLQHLLPVADQVALPVFARLRSDREALVGAYLTLTRILALAIVPFAALLWLAAPWLLDVLYPGRWQAAVPALRALCVAAAAAGLNSDPGILWLALGLTRLRLLWSAANVVALVPIVLIGTRYGITGVAYALAARSMAAAVAAQILTKRVAGVPHKAYLRAVLGGAWHRSPSP